MRPSQKMALTDAVARELQNRYTFAEIDFYLAEFGLTSLAKGNFTSKANYVKAVLRGIEGAALTEIADDLEITPHARRASVPPPRNWSNQNKFRLFISHIATEKDKATRLRDCLVPYHISGFVAHEDIHPTDEWQVEIERALRTMDAFFAIHTKGFSQSIWTQQEIGFAVALGAKIISFKMGENPTGFISKHQALPRLNRRAEDIAKEVNDLLLKDEQTAARLKEVIAANTDDEIPF